jgi:hypothetical protein
VGVDIRTHDGKYPISIHEESLTIHTTMGRQLGDVLDVLVHDVCASHYVQTTGIEGP